MLHYYLPVTTTRTENTSMKNAISKYINSPMNLEDEAQFIADMLALKFTRQDASIVLNDIHARLRA